MKVFLPGLLERLMGERDQLPDSVARALEDLLNTRSVAPPARYAAWPLARASVLNYGVAEPTGDADQAQLCASLKEAIERHEPRLADISAVLEPEPVAFDAVLQPSSLHDAVRRAPRPPRG